MFYISILSALFFLNDNFFCIAYFLLLLLLINFVYFLKCCHRRIFRIIWRRCSLIRGNYQKIWEVRRKGRRKRGVPEWKFEKLTQITTNERIKLSTVSALPYQFIITVRINHHAYFIKWNASCRHPPDLKTTPELYRFHILPIISHPIRNSACH